MGQCAEKEEETAEPYDDYNNIDGDSLPLAGLFSKPPPRINTYNLDCVPAKIEQLVQFSIKPEIHKVHEPYSII